MVLTGFLSAILPNDFFDRVMGNPTLEMVAMLVVGIPLYLCATSSTPLAAALMAKGLSPGAGLVPKIPAKRISASSLARGLSKPDSR